MQPKIIAYADLTWPVVAALPREMPMLIPLGLGIYDLEEAARRLGVDAACVLPALPYGLPCGADDPLDVLAVSPGLWRRVLVGASRELRGQGFRRVVFLNGYGDPGLKRRGLDLLDVPAARQRGQAWPPDLSRCVVIVSTGHTEQHGHHLPLSTDTLIVEAIAHRVQDQAAQDVFCLPVWPYGVSTHTREFPGTLNLGGRVFEDFFLAVVDRLVAQGAQMIYFSNGHGGNHSFLVNVVKLAGERHPTCFIATEWLHTTGPALSTVRESAIGGMGHGGELETSYILHLRPELVRMEQATIETDFVSTPNYTMDWVEGGRLIANPPWTDDTASGIYGDGTLGRAEKGRLWLAAAVAEKLEVLREIREQHARRQAKRAAARVD
jgi:creatinine amidohydrolase